MDSPPLIFHGFRLEDCNPKDYRTFAEILALVIDSTRAMDRVKPGPSHSSTYGQACMQCFKSKCRCVPRTEGGSCER